MQPTSTDITGLTAKRVQSLLAMGRESPGVDDADAALDLLKQSVSSKRPQLLKDSLRDLKSPLSPAVDGPLSFCRLVGISADDFQPLEGKTLIRCVTSSRVSSALLHKLANFGVLLMQELFPEPTRLTGLLVYSLATVNLRNRHRVRPSGDAEKLTAATMKVLADAPSVPQSLRKLAARSQSPKRR